MEAVKISDLFSYSFYGGLQGKDGRVVWIRQSFDPDANQAVYDLMEYRDSSIRTLLQRQGLRDVLFDDANALCFFGPSFCGRTPLYRLDLQADAVSRLGRVDWEGCHLECILPGQTIFFSAQSRDAAQKAETETGPKKDAASSIEMQARTLDSVEVFNEAALSAYGNRVLVAFDWQTGSCRQVSLPLQSVRFVCHTQNDVYYTASPVEGGLQRYADCLYRYDRTSGRSECLCRTSMNLFSLDVIGDQLYFFAGNGEPAGLSSNPQLYAFSLSEQTLEKKLAWEESPGCTVSVDYAPVCSPWTCVYEGRLFFTATIINHVNLFCFDGSHLHQVLEWPGTMDSFCFSDQKLYFIGAKPGGLQELYELCGEVLTQLSHFHPELDEKAIAPARPVFYTASNGTAQLGWVLEPIGYDPAKTYPGILWIHGGPKTVYSSVFSHQMQVMAAEGYFVFFCNPFGSDGQGNDYASLRGRFGSLDYADLCRFLDAVLGKYDEIDENRLGVIGGSYGGFMSAWMAAHSNRFRAAVADRGVTDWISLCNLSATGSDFIADQVGGGRFDAARLWHCSPLAYASRIHTPILFLCAGEDETVPYTQALELFHALQAQKKEARLVLFHEEGHHLPRSGRPLARIRGLIEIRDWMNRYVKGNKDYEA